MSNKNKALKFFRRFLGSKVTSAPQVLGQLQQYDVTVMVCELSSSHSLFSDPDVLSVKRILDKFYDSVANATYAMGGDLQNMFQGKCYCVFGAPNRLENPLDNAKKAESLILEKWYGTSDNELISIRIGMESGVLQCGIFGTSTRLVYEGIGDVYEGAENKLVSKRSPG